MSVVMIMFTGAVIQMYSTFNKANALADSSTGINIAFQRIDKQLRYASEINHPGLASDGNWYVEWDTTSAGSDACTQLRIAGGQLQERSWTGVPGSAPPFVPLVSGVDTPSSAPFVWQAAAGAQAHEQLQLSLSILSGPSRDASRTATTIGFTAMNSGQSFSVTNDGTTLVCQNGVGRP
jgi:hypothetical protein